MVTECALVEAIIRCMYFIVLYLLVFVYVYCTFIQFGIWLFWKGIQHKLVYAMNMCVPIDEY